MVCISYQFSIFRQLVGVTNDQHRTLMSSWVSNAYYVACKSIIIQNFESLQLQPSKGNTQSIFFFFLLKTVDIVDWKIKTFFPKLSLKIVRYSLNFVAFSAKNL